MALLRASTRTVRIPATYAETGKVEYWTANRLGNGWELTDPDGYSRWREGSWAACVGPFREILANHGLTSGLS